MRRALPAALVSAVLSALMFGAMPAAAVPATNFDGLVALSNCSGAVIRWSSSVGSDKALVLTNGHCFELMGATQVVVGQPAVRDVYLLSPAGGSAGTVQTTKLLYATMNQTDVALYQLGLTFKQLRVQYGVHPITLASARPGKYAAISIISGYWLTEYDCHLHGFAYRLHEDVWTWRNSLRYEDGGCPVIGGTSGSPVLNASRLEIGINNTRNEDGEMCTLNNPCEENRQGAETVHPGRGYGEETWIFYTCLSSRKIDLSKIGCRLAKP